MVPDKVEMCCHFTDQKIILHLIVLLRVLISNNGCFRSDFLIGLLRVHRPYGQSRLYPMTWLENK